MGSGRSRQSRHSEAPNGRPPSARPANARPPSARSPSDKPSSDRPPSARPSARPVSARPLNEQIHIEEDSTGHSFEKIFGGLLDEKVTEIDVDDPYIRSIHQVYNFLRFCEVVVKSKAPVKIIRLTTGVDGYRPDLQRERLSELANSLSWHGVSLQVKFSRTLHDREIRFNNGWVIKIGRGLDYFKPTGKFDLGYCDYDLRQCNETTVDIFHRKNMKISKN